MLILKGLTVAADSHSKVAQSDPQRQLIWGITWWEIMPDTKKAPVKSGAVGEASHLFLCRIVAKELC